MLDFGDGPVAPLRARAVDAHERFWDTPAREFRLSAIDLAAGDDVSRDVWGPEILLCASGRVVVTPSDGSSPVALEQGRAAFVPGSTERYTLVPAGNGASLYRATVNLT